MNRPRESVLNHGLRLHPCRRTVRQDELLAVQWAEIRYRLTGPPAVHGLNGADQWSSGGNVDQHWGLDQATAAKLSRNALMVASMSPSEWAREVKPASKAEGAR